ncbi:helix-turn-helix domain-containing protein [Roseateles sp. LYH14W]|uniref:Helix-turn-helix domain-containing protein n=1 Tax=Pelomonas parva TaxID=3299032 RepID=A0ABW7F5G4_9BURK
MNMDTEPPRVGAALQALRASRGLSLDDLSKRAGVSKSMLSQIERNQANPTVAVVWRLANALGVEMGELLGGERAATPAIETVPAHATPGLTSPDGLCKLRILGPIELAGQFEWYELSVQAGGLLDSHAHEPGSREHLSVLTGSLEVTAQGVTSRLKAGETARYAVDGPHAIRNVGKSAATALLVVLHP